MKTVLSVAALLVITACLPAVPPYWAKRNAYLRGEGEARAFYASGSAKDTTESLARTSAENKARNQLARIMQRFTTSVVNAYKSEGHAIGDEGRPHDVLIATLERAETVGYWRNPDNKLPDISALVKADFSSYLAAMERVEGLDESFLNFVRENAAGLFDKFRAAGDHDDWHS